MMHRRITVARIPPVITTVPAVIRPILHQTLKGRAAGTRVTLGREPRPPRLQPHVSGGVASPKYRILVPPSPARSLANTLWST